MNRTAYQIKAYPLNGVENGQFNIEIESSIRRFNPDQIFSSFMSSESFNVIEKTIIWGEKRGDKSRIMISLIPNHEDALSEIHTILEKITII